MKRSRIKPISDKRRATLPARRECMEIVRARDKVCQFWTHVCDSSLDHEDWLVCWEDRFCSGPLDGHEPRHRSQGGDPTNPDEVQLICRHHHDFVHNWPLLAKALNL